MFTMWSWSPSIISLLLWKVYEGLVYMDFSQKIMEEKGYGKTSTTFSRKAK